MGHNWLGILYNRTSVAGWTPSGTFKGGPGGCARCHLTGGWKQSLGALDINKDTNKSPGQDAYFTGSGIASFAKLGWNAGDLDSDWTGSDTQKQANTIQCLMCHASNYKPGNIALSSSNYTEYGTGVDTKTVFNAGKRIPTFKDATYGDDGSVVDYMYANVKQAVYVYNGSSWLDRGMQGIFLLPDYTIAALQSISKTPSNEACLRCHDFAGGGPRNKRGMWFRNDKDANGVQKYDVHAAMSCLDCHKTDKMLGGSSNHKMSLGLSSDIWARDIKLGAYYYDRSKHSSECSNSDCHGTRPHKNSLLNDHYAGAEGVIGDGKPSGKVDCRTCHIPYQYGQESKDFTKVVLDTTTGLFDSKQVNRTTGTMRDITNVTKYERPVYKWYDMKHEGHGPALATRADAEAKITPFTNYTITAIADGSGKKIPLKIGVLAQTGNIFLAASDKPGNPDGSPFVPPATSVEANMNYTPLSYSTVNGLTYEQANQYIIDYNLYSAGVSNFLLGHRVRPKAEALSCPDCHSNKAFFTNLGYGADADILSTVYGQ